MKLNRFAIALLWLTASASFGQPPDRAPYLDPSLPPERRAADLVSRMTLEEKVLQMQSTAPAIPRLGVRRLQLVERGAARRRPGPRHRLPAGDRTRRHLGHRPDAPGGRHHLHRSAGQVQRRPDASRPFRPGRARDPSRPHRRADVLVAEHQHLPGSPLGTRPGNLRRRSLSDRPHGRRVRHRDAGRRPPLPEGRLHAEALRGAQRSGAGTARLRRQGERVRPREHVPAGVPGGGRSRARPIRSCASTTP